MNSKSKLIIVGCGPKALNVLVKAKVLSSLGWNVPEIVVIEKSSIGANWDGKNGYTDGNGVLGISPLKTFDHPTQSIFGDAVYQGMQKYSFMNYLASTGRQEKWINGGSKLITHKEFALYLKWIALDFTENIIFGEVKKISIKEKKWAVTYSVHSNKSSKMTDYVDGLIMTGPGKSLDYPDCEPDNVTVFESKSWWSYKKKFKNFSGRVALVGGGISAGSIFDALMPLLSLRGKVDWFTRKGLFTRSENLVNNQRFSNVDLWEKIPQDARRSFIERTERGSIDLETSSTMNTYREQFREIIGNIKDIEASHDAVFVKFEDGIGLKEFGYSKIIFCMGYDNTSFLNLFDDETKVKVLSCIKNGSDKNIVSLIEECLEQDMTLPGFNPILQLPMLSHLNVGIGASTLGSPSLTSDRLLIPWVSRTHKGEGIGLKIVSTAKKGDCLIVTRDYKENEIVVKGYPTKFLTKRTKTSVQIAPEMHFEPSFWFVKANHSCRPNCGINLNEYGGYSLVAMEYIQKGQEITWDYAMTEYKSIALSGLCECGSVWCRGSIGGYKDLSSNTLKQYKKFIAPYLAKYYE